MGLEGRALRIDQRVAADCSITREGSLTATAIDPSGRAWAAASGQLWVHETAGWAEVWRDPAWRLPFVSLHVEPGLVVAATADGGILEGRWNG